MYVYSMPDLVFYRLVIGCIDKRIWTCPKRICPVPPSTTRQPVRVHVRVRVHPLAVMSFAGTSPVPTSTLVCVSALAPVPTGIF